MTAAPFNAVIKLVLGSGSAPDIRSAIAGLWVVVAPLSQNHRQVLAKIESFALQSNLTEYFERASVHAAMALLGQATVTDSAREQLAELLLDNGWNPLAPVAAM